MTDSTPTEGTRVKSITARIVELARRRPLTLVLVVALLWPAQLTVRGLYRSGQAQVLASPVDLATGARSSEHFTVRRHGTYRVVVEMDRKGSARQIAEQALGSFRKLDGALSVAWSVRHRGRTLVHEEAPGAKSSVRLSANRHGLVLGRFKGQSGEKYSVDIWVHSGNSRWNELHPVLKVYSAGVVEEATVLFVDAIIVGAAIGFILSVLGLARALFRRLSGG